VDDKLADDYRGRIGCPPVSGADAETLRSLHRAHQMSVPFENLSIHLGEPISLESGDLFGKVVTRRRGGFCYELNGLFALLLEALGMRVQRVAARVSGRRPGIRRR
jgi:N-hydroxyarylamine O-acetyltransferase